MSQAFLPFHCGKCTKVFPTPSDRNRHEKKHDKAFSCILCSRGFGQLSDLQRHRFSHQHKNFRLKCTFPKCTFGRTHRKDYLWQHMKRIHRSREKGVSEAVLRKYYEESQSATLLKGTDIYEKNLQLLESVYLGDEETIKRLIAEGADVLTEDYHNWHNTMHLAIQRGHASILKILVEVAAKDHCQNHQKQKHHDCPFRDNINYSAKSSLLELAARKANPTMIRIVLNARLHAKADTNNSDPALDSLSKKRQDAIVKALIDHHENLNYLDVSKAALVGVAQGGDPVLVQNIFDLDDRGIFYRDYKWNLYDAATRGDSKRLSALRSQPIFSRAVRPDMLPQAFRTAAQAGHAAIVYEALNDCTTITMSQHDFDSAFRSAAKGGHLPVMQMLLDSSAVSDGKAKLLELPAYYDPDRLVPWYYSNVDHRYGIERVTSLHLVAISGQHIVDNLIKGGFEINSKDSNNLTPLSYALGRNPFSIYFEKESVKEEVAKVLLDAGAKVAPGDLPFMSLSLREKYSEQVVDDSGNGN